MHKRYLKQSVERLNERLNRPLAGWTRGPDNKLTGNIGHLFLDHAACYGGYRLTEIFNEGGGQCGFNDGGTSTRLSNKEMTAYLRGIHDTLDVQKHA